MNTPRGAILRILLLLAVAVTPAAAQLGITAAAGPVSSNLSFSTGNDYRHALTGYAAGVAFTIATRRGIEFSPELFVVRKGSGLDYPYDLRIEYRLTYLEIPLLLRHTWRTAGAVRPYVVAGPEIAFTVGCSTKAINSPANGNTIVYDPCTTGEAGISEDQPNPIDAGAIVGAGVSVGRYSASLRYDYGLTNIYSRYGGTGTIRNVTWTALVGIRF